MRRNTRLGELRELRRRVHDAYAAAAEDPSSTAGMEEVTREFEATTRDGLEDREQVVAHLGPVARWEIYWVDLEPRVGSEQGGARRPAIVVSNDGFNAHFDLVTVIPLTKREGTRRRVSELEVLERIGILTDEGHQLEIGNRVLEHLGVAFEAEELWRERPTAAPLWEGAALVVGGAAFSYLTVPEEDHAAMERHFRERSRLVDDFPGFPYLQLLCPQSGSATHAFLTAWDSREAFRRYMTSEEHALSHGQEPGEIMARTECATRPSRCSWIPGGTRTGLPHDELGRLEITADAPPAAGR